MLANKLKEKNNKTTRKWTPLDSLDNCYVAVEIDLQEAG